MALSPSASSAPAWCSPASTWWSSYRSSGSRSGPRSQAPSSARGWIGGGLLLGVPYAAWHLARNGQILTTSAEVKQQWTDEYVVQTFGGWFTGDHVRFLGDLTIEMIQMIVRAVDGRARSGTLAGPSRRSSSSPLAVLGSANRRIDMQRTGTASALPAGPPSWSVLFSVSEVRRRPRGRSDLGALVVRVSGPSGGRLRHRRRRRRRHPRRRSTATRSWLSLQWSSGRSCCSPAGVDATLNGKFGYPGRSRSIEPPTGSLSQARMPPTELSMPASSVTGSTTSIRSSTSMG